MWMTLAFLATLGSTPGQSGTLALTNARLTYSALGAPRPSNKFLPGDSFVLGVDLVKDTGPVNDPAISGMAAMTRMLTS